MLLGQYMLSSTSGACKLSFDYINTPAQFRALKNAKFSIIQQKYYKPSLV
jgi:hypothetical protein